MKAHVRWMGIICLLGMVALPEPGSAAIVQVNSVSGDGGAGDPAFATNIMPAASADLVNMGQLSLFSAATVGLPGTQNVGLLHDGTLGNPTGFSAVYGADDPPGDGMWSTTFTLDTSFSPLGYTITEIRTHSGYNQDRVQQTYEVWFTTVANPTFTQLGGTFEFHPNTSADSYRSTLIQLTDTTGTLITGATAIRFDIKPALGGGVAVGDRETIFREFDVLGEAIPEPSAALLGLVGSLLVWSNRRAQTRC